MIEMPEAFHTATDELAFAADWAGTPGEVLAIGDAESHLRDWPAALRAQGEPVPQTLPIGGAMRYRAVPG
jgi:hypothetical protein